MGKMFSILHYEYKMPFKRMVTWGILLVATTNSMLDNITSDGQDTMRVSYRFSVDKERHITCQLSAVSNSFSKGAVPMHLDFI